MTRRAIYPGSFDPLTNGHVDVISRARVQFDEVIVAVAHNDAKSALFTREERIQLIHETKAIHNWNNVHVTPLDGLLVDFAKSLNVHAIIRGLRAISDFEYEFQMALMNRKLAPSIETLFLMPTEEYTYLSSRIVKEVARLHGDIQSLVPPPIAKALQQKFL